MILAFDRDSAWKFEKLTHRKSHADDKRMKRNAEKFGKWLIDLLKVTAPRELEKGEKYHCQGVLLHPDNNEYLHDHVDPWTWLAYSPKDDANLKLNEVCIDHWFIRDPTYGIYD